MREGERVTIREPDELRKGHGWSFSEGVFI